MPTPAQPSSNVTSLPRCNDAIASMTAYQPPVADDTIRLRLDRNEGPAHPTLFEYPELQVLLPELARRYPSTSSLQARIAGQLGVDVGQVILTAGADDAIDRTCRAVLQPGDRAIVPTPTFAMIPHSIAVAGGHAVQIDWLCGPFPVERVLESCDERTRLIALVSPGNPTGMEIPAGDIERIATAAHETQTLVLLDQAYIDFADDPPPMEQLLSAPNMVITRTMSKAWGLAGMRIGYAVGDERVINWLRCIGSPYPCSGLSLAVAEHMIETGREQTQLFIARVRNERTALAALLDKVGAIEVWPSQTNFVFARFTDAGAIRQHLAESGIAVRQFTSTPELAECLRISCPGNEREFALLTDALGVCALTQAESPSEARS